MTLSHLTISTLAAGTAAIAIVITPLYLHKPPERPITIAWLWPEEALTPPSDPPFTHHVTTQRIVAITEVAKTPPLAAAEPQPQQHTEALHPAIQNVCEKEGGRKIFTHRGRRWHCVYGRRR